MPVALQVCSTRQQVARGGRRELRNIESGAQEVHEGPRTHAHAWLARTQLFRPPLRSLLTQAHVDTDCPGSGRLCALQNCCHKCARFTMQLNELSLVLNKVKLKYKNWVKANGRLIEPNNTKVRHGMREDPCHGVATV